MNSLAEATQPLQRVNIVRHILTDDGKFPNNGLLPLLLYREAYQPPQHEATSFIKELLETNSWGSAWEDGIYDYDHYHSTAHEVIIVTKGSVRVQFGGPNGISLTLEKGDVVIIPAGVAHKKIDDADGFLCVGAYPNGQEYDMNYGDKAERPRADENIKNLPLPENDPLYGKDGPLIKNWFSETDQHASVL